MPSRWDIRGELGDIWKSSRPANADPPPGPPPDQPSITPPSHNRTTRIILKTTLINSIAFLIIVTIGIYSAFSFFNPLADILSNPLDKYRVYDPMLKDTNLLASYTPEEESMPYGRILSTETRPRDSRVIKITGMTANLPEDRHVVLVVDVEDQRICFPKWPFIAPNTAFRTEIYEGGPEGACALSLYAVDEKYYRKIKTWLKQERFGGMPLIPLRYRLDEVKVLVGEG